MHGFQPNSSRRREPEGGVIHGPGTGTSDSIEDAVPAGTCIMPADSTEQIGDQALAGMGACGFTPKSQRKDVDVRLSNGEQSCPLDQVRAVDVQALDALKNATHNPVSEGLGFPAGRSDDAMFFADGGLVTRMGNSYSGGNVAGQISINRGAPGGVMSSIVAPAAPAAVPGVPETSVRMLSAPASGLGISDSSAQRQQFFDQAESSTAASRAARSMVSPVAPLAPVPGAPRSPGGFGPTTRWALPARPCPAPWTRAARLALGFKPRGYANGGVLEEEERRRRNNFGDAAAAAGNSTVAQLGAPRPATAGAGSEAALRFAGESLTDAQQSRVVSRFDQDQRDRAAGARCHPASDAGGGFCTSCPASGNAMAAAGGFGPTASSRPVAGSLEGANAQAANLRAFNASVPVGGLTVINNPGAGRSTGHVRPGRPAHGRRARVVEPATRLPARSGCGGGRSRPGAEPAASRARGRAPGSRHSARRSGLPERGPARGGRRAAPGRAHRRRGPARGRHQFRPPRRSGRGQSPTRHAGCGSGGRGRAAPHRA